MPTMTISRCWPRRAYSAAWWPREAQRTFMAEQGHFSCALHAGAITALSGFLLHSFVDFNLHIPSNALLFLLSAYLATSPPLPSGSSMPRRRIRTREHAHAANDPQVAI